MANVGCLLLCLNVKRRRFTSCQYAVPKQSFYSFSESLRHQEFGSSVTKIFSLVSLIKLIGQQLWCVKQSLGSINQFFKCIHSIYLTESVQDCITDNRLLWWSHLSAEGEVHQYVLYHQLDGNLMINLDYINKHSVDCPLGGELFWLFTSRELRPFVIEQFFYKLRSNLNAQEWQFPCQH